MTTKIYGPWIDWNGGECPVPPDMRVTVKFRDGDSQSGHPAYAYAYSWRHDGDGADIVEYRIVIEQADLNAAEKLLFSYGYTIIPPATPPSRLGARYEAAWLLRLKRDRVHRRLSDRRCRNRHCDCLPRAVALVVRKAADSRPHRIGANHE